MSNKKKTLYNGNRYVGGFSNAVNSGLISLAGFNAIDFTGTSTDHIYGRESDTFSSYAFEHSNIQKIDLSGFVFAAGRYPTARENGYKIFYHNDLHTVTKINLSDADFLDTEGSSTGGDDLYTASHTFDGCNLSSLNELQLNMTHFSSPGLL
ncbi:hypothetical protein FACS1894166_12930 [Bacilli bacterium]|nr:hypothetical protein FACS1894166_12930 [Bacilli bacterium]